MTMWKGVDTKTQNGNVVYILFRSFPFFSLKAILFHKLKNLNLGISKLIMKFTYNEPEDNRVFRSILLRVLVTIYVYGKMVEWYICIGVIMTMGSKSEILHMRGILTRLEIT